MLPYTRSFQAFVLSLFTFAASGLSQTSVSLQQTYSPGGAMGDRIYAVDLNNDGVPDIVTTNLNDTCEFTVSLSDGHGNFLPPSSTAVSISIGPQPSDAILYCPMVAGDFNGDGKTDLFFVGAGSRQFMLFPGNGDGTFGAPISSLVNIPDGAYLVLYIAAADFNHDGAVDVVVEYTGGNAPPAILLLEGDGHFGFTPVTMAANTFGQDFTVGDFDADGNVDFAYNTGCSSGSCTTEHVLYGDGHLGFTDTTALTVNGSLNLTAGDLNSDGRTDLFGIDGATNQLVTLYGQKDRTFDAYYSPLPTGGEIGNPFTGAAEPSLQLADLNSDGRMDIVGEFNHAFSGKTQKLVFFLGTRSLGQFVEHSVFLPAHKYTTNPVAGDFNRDRKPDIVVNQGDDPAPYQASASILTTALNTTNAGSWSNCDYPLQAQGVMLCAPIANAESPVNFSATGSALMPLRKMELWVDGRKIAQQDHTWEGNAWFNYSGAFNPGPHRGTLFATDIGNDHQRLDFNFHVGMGPCATPASEGVSICAPANGSSVPSPTLVEAAANIAGTLDRMELWVDGVKKYTEKVSLSFNAQVNLSAGNHRFDVLAVNTDGAEWRQTAHAVTGP